MIRKKIASLMAFIMITSVISGLTPFAVEVSAAPRYNFVRADEKMEANNNTQTYLTPGTGAPNPEVTDGSPTTGTATVKWNTLTAAGASLETGKYRLEYPISDGVIARFEIEKTFSDYKVIYTLINTSTGLPFPVDKTSANGVNDYRINTGPNGYVVTENFTTGGSLYKAERGADDIPIFTVQPGYGLTFEFQPKNGKAVRVSFKTETSGEIRFTTSGINEGVIYDFSLGIVNGSNIENVETLSLMTGLVKSSFLSVAKANVGGSVVDMTEIVDLRSGETAKAENRINMSILLPEVWEASKNRFVSITELYSENFNNAAAAKAAYKNLATSRGYGNVRAQFRLTDSFGKLYNVFVGSLFDEAASGSYVEPSGVGYKPSGTTATPYIDPSEGKIYMEIGPLDANILFNRVDIFVNSYNGAVRNENFSSTQTVIDSKGVAYTFIKYKLVNVHGVYYVEFQPYLFLDNGVYKGIDGVYYLYDDNGVISSAQSNASTKDKLMLPSNLGSYSGYSVKYYIVFVPTVPSGTATIRVWSQKGTYTTSAQDVSIDTPQSFDIVSYTLTIRDEITNPSDYRDKADLSIDMSWDIADPAVLDILLPNEGDYVKIHYLITNMKKPSGYNDPIESKPAACIIVRIEKVPKSAAYPLSFKIEYEMCTETGNPNELTPTIVPEADIPSAYASTNRSIRAYVRFNFVAHTKLSSFQEPVFEYPSINFLNVRPSKIAFNSATLTDYEAPASLYDSLTLNDVSLLQVPPPQNLRITDNRYTQSPGTIISMVVNWSIPEIQIKSYLETMPKYPDYEVGSDIYMSHSQTALKDLQAELDKITDSVLKKKYIDDHVYVFDCKGTAIPDIDISAAKAKLGTDEKTILELLRSGKVVAIRNIPHSMAADPAKSQLISGLDKNQRYYYTMGLTVTFISGQKTRLEFSTLIGIVGETTLTDPQTPNPLEKLPEAPVFVLPIEKGSNNAKVTWKPVEETPVQGKTIEIGYEIVRIRDEQLKTAGKAPDTDILNTRLEFADFYSRVTNTQKTGIELRPDGSYFVIPSSGAAQQPPGFTLTYSSTGTPVIMEDNTLIPNNVYFYYVRAYKIVDGDYSKKVYSVWSRVSVTSDPVAPPENLVYERDRTDFDKEKEAVISFDAPVFDQTLDLTKNTLGGYKFQYQIRLENGDWSDPIDMDAAYLYNNNNVMPNKTGYRHYFYKITGLQSGKTYSIRVRIVDANGEPSVYTNIAEIRTLLNQKDYDNEVLTGDWAAYLKDKLQGLIKVNWWSAAVSNDSYVQFRPSTFPSFISDSSNAGLVFQAPSANKTEYYIPAASFKLAAGGNKSFIIEGNGLRIVVPASVLDLNANEAVLKINERVKAKAVSDYYVKITVTYLTTGAVNGSQPLTKVASVSIDIVGSIKTTSAIDSEIYDALIALVAKRTDSDAVKAEFKKLIDSGTSNEELVKYVDKIVADVKTEFQASFNKLRAANLKESYSIGAFAKGVQIMYTPADNKSIVKGYRSSSTLWEEQSLTNSGSAKVITAAQAGSYVFAGSSIDNIKLDGINGAEDAASLIIKYGLTDVFVPGMNMTRAATGYEFATVIARMAGAKNTEDPFEFLKNKGISTTGIKSQGAISKQEALYLMSCLYELKTGKKIASVSITNYGLTSGIKNLDSKYLKAVQVAYQLGIYSDKSMDAKASASVNDMLQMLVNLNKKVKL